MAPVDPPPPSPYPTPIAGLQNSYQCDLVLIPRHFTEMHSSPAVHKYREDVILRFSRIPNSVRFVETGLPFWKPLACVLSYFFEDS